MDSLQRIKAQSDAQAKFKLDESRHADKLAVLHDVKTSNLEAMRGLIQYLDGKVARTEVVNQLNSISTPDVDKVVKAVDQLAKKIPPQLDLSSLEKGINALEAQLKLIPKAHQELPEQKESVEVTNLGDIDFTTLEKTITDEVSKLVKSQKAPIVDVKASDVTVNVDTKEFTKGLKDLLKAVGGIKFPEVPKTDLTKVEKKLDESNKHLKTIAEKKFGGGGGGGNGTPYIDSTGKPVNVELVGGAVPITGTITAEASTLAEFQYNDSDNTTTASTEYYGFTKPDGTWLVKQSTDTTMRYATITNNGAVTTYADAWAAIASLTYGRMDQAF